jgi:hypothetical protein
MASFTEAKKDHRGFLFVKIDHLINTLLLVLMTSGTRHGREGLLAIVTGSTAFALVHIRHGHFRAAFLH